MNDQPATTFLLGAAAMFLAIDVMAREAPAAGAGEPPELLDATYPGGDARGRAITLGADGSVYVVGWTDDPGLPGALNSKTGFSDMYVMKFSADLGSLEWSRYMGGVGEIFHQEVATDCAPMPDGGVAVTGRCETPDFPLVNAIDTERGGEADAVVFRLGPDGDIVFSTYLGGSGDENLMDGITNFSTWFGEIEVASDGTIIVAGNTRSSDFPTVNAIDDTFGGFSPDVFVTRLTSDGQTILASTYLGDVYTDEVWDMTLDHLDRPIIVGNAGPGWPKTDGGWSHGDLSSSGLEYVTRLTADVQTVDYTAWLESVGNTGGSFDFYAVGVAPDGTVTVGGRAGDQFTPMPDDAYQSELMGGSPTRDILVLSLSPDGSTLDGATYLGIQERGEFTVGLAVNSHGEIMLARNYEKNPVNSRIYSFNPALTALSQDTFALVSPGTTVSLRLDPMNNLLGLALGLGDTPPDAFSSTPEGSYVARWDMKRPPSDEIPGDLDGNGVVNFNDLLQLLAAWGDCTSCPPSFAGDLNDDCTVGFSDLVILLANWG